MTDDDPTAWLGDPVAMHVTGAGDVVVSAPPRERGTLVITLVRAPLIEDPSRREPDTFVRVNLDGARGLLKALEAGIAQLEEHADS
jgi:hypothetical protein